MVGEEGRGGLQRGLRAVRRAPSPRQRPRGGENSPEPEPQCDQRARLESCDPSESVISLLTLQLDANYINELLDYISQNANSTRLLSACPSATRGMNTNPIMLCDTRGCS